ncbi:PglL family O-oligosaccharyltransferase [Acinetobacter sp. MD2(2019)]|uniref:PglL family O-oligosaccharyltransferase n=1 Tax=Acinetobacter sp. MD2(2019) TaxID=2605273 RepID=UPI002D1F07DB|nr:Wzy polymerase domain-containing protein [Acinetobacter sp. MD2(2019)]MEB3753240.1 O-antigen ligase C-terminal domain-containing protein [Acinetobacter sp. MD2(2019)]
MQRYLLLIVALLLGLSWLSPFHYTPWLTFSSELLAYAAALCLLGMYSEKSLFFPKIQLPLLFIACIPLLQFGLGIELYWNKALLSFLYLFAFMSMVIVGNNLGQEQYLRQKIMSGFALLTFIVGLLCVAMALLQWLDLEGGLRQVMMQLRGNRPYANFAQPNNMATFLMMSLMGCLYLFETRRLPTWLISLGAAFLVFTIALSQSRTPWVACFVFSVYFIWNKNSLQRFKMPHLAFWVLAYIGCLLLVPALNNLLVQLGFSHSQMGDVIERASSSHSRFNIWMQMIYAIQQHPWLGYGWNQTSVAQLAGADFLAHNERTNSAHNLILEMLVWNGVILGTAIVAYAMWWLVKLLKQRDRESVIAMATVGCVLIHAMFEFPQNYAYFLFPIGFLLGLTQANMPKLSSIEIKSSINTTILVIGILLYGLIWRDYLNSVDVLNEAHKHSDQGLPFKHSQKIYVLDQFEHRADWYVLNRFSKCTDAQLADFHRAVVITPTHYDLFKYAQLLAYNGKMQEAAHQLQLIRGLYQTDHAASELLVAKDQNGRALSLAVSKALVPHH